MLKKVQVVMLSSEGKAHNGELIIVPTSRDLRIFQHSNSTEKANHLYFLLDEEIKEGDWFVTNQACQ